MADKPVNIIYSICAIMILLGLLILSSNQIKIQIEKNNICEEDLDFELSKLFDIPNAWYQNIDDNYYKCCYYGIINILNDNNQKEKICMRFKK